MATRRAAAKAKATVERRTPKGPRAARSGVGAGREFRNEIVVARTGRPRSEWFAVLDTFDCRANGHKAAAAHLVAVHGVSPWWAQAITIEYERAKGIRSYGERADGFASTVQRALAVPAERAWQGFVDPDEVAQWTNLPHRHNFREGGRWRDADGGRGAFVRIVEGRFVRFTWNHPRRGPGSFVDVDLLVRGDDRCIVKVTHRHIRSAEEREDLRSHWSWALDSFKSFVEKGVAIPHDAWATAR